MSLKGLRLRHLVAQGPGVTPATIEFTAGLNVLHGASNTGKSFVVEAIDFMLGGRKPLRDIPERVKYDRLLLGIETIEGESFTLQRSVQGGAFLVFPGLHQVTPGSDVQGTELADQHSDRSSDNVSSYLLERCGLSGKRIRKNKLGLTLSLSFRQLARLVIIDENEIIRTVSPLSDGNPVNETSNFAAFKVVLTGIDDSALTANLPKAAELQSRDAQLELLDQLRERARQRLDDLTNDPEDLEGQLNRIDATLAGHEVQLNATETQYRGLVMQRRDLRRKLEEGYERRDEIASLVERFALLDRHYLSDIARLGAIEEAGTLFETLGSGPCPICGSDAECRRRVKSTDGVTDVVAAARAEASKVRVLRSELKATVGELNRESRGHTARLPRIEEELRRVSAGVDQLVAPNLSTLRAGYKRVMDNRGPVVEALEVKRSIAELDREKVRIEGGPGQPSESSIVDGDLPTSVAATFAECVERLLEAWHFPERGRVFFDPKARDLVIAGKQRNAQGKGLRAITHAAFTLGILDLCRQGNTPHPGFVVLDSPLLAYREPEGAEDDLSGTDLKDRFYADLAAWPADRQVIIVENVDPPAVVRSGAGITFFSANPREGRYGLFPIPEKETNEGPAPQ